CDFLAEAPYAWGQELPCGWSRSAYLLLGGVRHSPLPLFAINRSAALFALLGVAPHSKRYASTTTPTISPFLVVVLTKSQPSTSAKRVGVCVFTSMSVARVANC